MLESKKWPLSIASILSLIGLGSAIYLTRLYYGVHEGSASFHSFCNINAAMSCTTVASSRYASLFTVPLSSFVAGWFVALFLITLIARSFEWRREGLATGLVMSGFASVYSLVLIVVMAVVLKTLCLFCLIIDGVNFGLFAIFLIQLRRTADGSPLFHGIDMKKTQGFFGLVLGSMFVMVVMLRPSHADEEANQPDVAVLAESFVQTTAVAVHPRTGAPVLGNSNAPVTVVEFSDFQCPHCRKAAVIMNSVMARFPKEVKVIFRNFPLDPACNRVMKQSLHRYSCQMARVALCAEGQGKFQPVYERIFEEQEKLVADSATAIPTAEGMNLDQLKGCVDSDETKRAVLEDIEEGLRLGVEVTPTLFVNGHKMEGAMPLEAWEKIIPALVTAGTSASGGK